MLTRCAPVGTGIGARPMGGGGTGPVAVPATPPVARASHALDDAGASAPRRWVAEPSLGGGWREERHAAPVFRHRARIAAAHSFYKYRPPRFVGNVAFSQALCSKHVPEETETRVCDLTVVNIKQCFEAYDCKMCSDEILSKTVATNGDVMDAACIIFKAAVKRIVGGSLTTIENYPFQAGLLSSWDQNWYGQSCGGTIITQRSILTAADCFGIFTTTNLYRVRVGSTFANSGGVVHNVLQNILHPSFNRNTLDNDVAVVRLASNIGFNNQARAAAIAGPNYYPADNQPVWAIGWGTTSPGGPTSEQLRHVQVWTVNQATCRNRYAELGAVVTDNMLCSGWLDVGGRDQCLGDSGGPLIHSGTVVGVYSWGASCALARYPGVNVRVSRYAIWILFNS